MKQSKILFIAVVVSMLVACGGGATVETTTSTTTMGQELMDLNESYKNGILTEKEYNKAKKNAMERYDD